MDLKSSFKSAQSKFYKWTFNWMLDRDTPGYNKTPDLLDFITIFQILGFTVTHADALEISKLNWGEKGLKISISCGHSGMRYVLEGVNDCSCSQKMMDSVRQIMIHKDPKQRNEMCSNIRLLDVSEGQKLVIQTVLIHLVDMIHEAAKDNDQNLNMLEVDVKDNEENQNIVEKVKTPSKTETSASNYLCIETTTKREIPFEDVFTPSVPIIQQEIIVNSSEEIMSPGRYRSLDTLTGKKVLPDELPEPGYLYKKEDVTEKKSVPAITYSSPNLSIPSKPSNTSSPVPNVDMLKQGYSKLLSVQELVKDVIEIIENSQEIPKFSIDVSNIKASAESLCIKKSTLTNSNSNPNLVVKRNVRPLCRPSIRSALSVKSAVTTASTSTLTKPTTGRKSSENVSPTLKTNNKPSTASSGFKKYAHIKSTIPKGNASKK